VDDGSAPPHIAPHDPPPYVYAPSDIGPRQTREIELCAKASQFDWLYTGGAAAGTIGSILLNTKVLKQQEEPGVRLMGPGFIGLFWGGFLSGGYLSLPKCDATWAYGTPPEGNVRAAWPVAAAISMVSIASAPALDWIFLAMGSALTGSLLPYLVPPKPWAAKLEIERIRVGVTGDSASVSWGTSF
jgi:hypothetical protein